VGLAELSYQTTFGAFWAEKSASGEQWRRQNLLRGGAKLEIMSWGTRV